MKIKMPCKLCELSIDQQQKLGFSNCNHTTFLSQTSPISSLPISSNLQNSSLFMPPIREMMLAAYLFRGYYQPAGPLISVPHGHTQPTLGKSAPLSEPSPSTPPPPTHQPPPPSSVGDSSDSEVIITSITTAKEATPPQQPPPPPPPQSYRFGQFPPSHTGYPYAYPQYYPAPPPGPGFVHHDLCYPPNPYLHHKTYPPTYRRYITPLAGSQYFSPNQEIYNTQPTAANPPNQQVVTASPSAANVSSYQPSPSGPPPPTLIETYPPPPTLVETYAPAPHYYPPGYGPPPPSCYTHSPSTRTLPYINPTYQSCPCPMQSCPKNGLTGPLTGDSKRSNITSIAKESFPLPPVALALPLEPASATGPPSPARGSAGMPPPPSPAGATYQPPPPTTPKQEALELLDLKPAEKKRQARVGKAMVRNTIASHNNATMLLMVGQTTNELKVKREAESPKEIEHKKEAMSDVDLNIKLDNTIHETTMETYKNGVNDNEFTEKSIETIQQVQCLKMEDKKEVIQLIPEVINKVEEKEEDVLRQPCVKTVAENVKVKNMKRKHSFTNDVKTENESECSAAKKQLLQKPPSPTCPNGSYKDLIKKSTTSIKINNGKKKLVEARNPRVRAKITRLKRSTTKRKISVTKGDTCNNNNNTTTKRLKSSKPLIDSNLHNSKQNSRENKDKFNNDSELIENKEPAIKKNNFRKGSVNSKKIKKTAAAVLDNLIAKNIDRTIDSVVVGESLTRTTTCKNNNDPSALKTQEKCSKINKQDVKRECVTNNKKSTNSNKTIAVKSSSSSSTTTKIDSNCRKIGACKRKTKNSTEIVCQIVTKIPRKSLLPKWSNGWGWEGEPYEAKVFLNSDEATTIRKCYPAMRHEEGDVIEPRDCVLLKAGARKNDLPFVAKIAALWENPEDGEMMMSLLWYYRPEHTDQGRLESDQPDEVFASRHKDSNSVACIEDKCYVLTYNEYCRYRKNMKRIEEGIEDIGPIVPENEPYPREHRQPPLTMQLSPDMVFFCRRVYDFRQKRMFKNPT